MWKRLNRSRAVQAKAGADKVAGAAKDATGNPGSKLQGAAGDAKSAAGSLKQVGTSCCLCAASSLRSHVLPSS